MYNNEVTYNENWSTPENKKALDKLRKKFFPKSSCVPDCPVGWAPEVLELLNTIDKELGIAYNESTIMGYYPQDITPSDIFIAPFKRALYAFKKRFLYFSKESNFYKIHVEGKSKAALLLEVLYEALAPYKYIYNVLRVKHINPILNNVLKPKVRLSQIKEKYGELRIYYSCPEVYDKYVDKLIRTTEVKLAIKGCYYPVETFYNSGVSYSVGTEYRPDTIKTQKRTSNDGSTSIDVTETLYRGIMKDLGLNLEEIKLKSNKKRKDKKR